MGLLDKLFGKRGNGGDKVPTPTPLAPLRQPSIWLERRAGVVSMNRLGGLPSLPNDIDWPRQTATGLPLHFLAQIDLATLPPTPLDNAVDDARLPAQGLLLFFADLEEEMLWDEDDRGGHHGSTRVIYAPQRSPDRAPPADIPKIGHTFGEVANGRTEGLKIFPSRGLTPHVIDTFVGAELYFQGPDSRRADALTMASIERATGRAVPVFDRRERRNPYEHAAVWLEAHDAQGRLKRDAHIARHQMLGAAINVQGSAREARHHDWVLLLQLDSDSGVDERFTFCDMGMAQFWINREDLTALRFDRAWASTEGG